MTFTISEMTQALQQIGYEIREDEESEDFRWNGLQTETRSYKVKNVYRHGVNMTEDRHWEKGDDRVKWVFNHELSKRLLALFK